MKITRQGHGADHGPKDRKLDIASATWNGQLKLLELKAKGVRDFNTAAKHDYTIAIRLDEFGQLLRAMGGTELSGSLSSMVRLIATASGLSLKTETASSP